MEGDIMFEGDVADVVNTLMRGIGALRVRHGKLSTDILAAVVSGAISQIGKGEGESETKGEFVFNPDGYATSGECQTAIRISGRVHMFPVRAWVGTGTGMQMRWYPSTHGES